MKANQRIRETAAANNVRLWQIADKLCTHEVTLIKRLRYELPQPERDRILAIIEELKREQEAIS